MTPAPREVPVRASDQPPVPPAGLPSPPRSSGAALPAPLVAAGSPPTPTGAAEPSPPPPGEATAFPSEAPPEPAVADGAGCAPGEVDGVTVATSDGSALGVEDGAPGEGAADGVAMGFASAGTST